MSRATGKVMDFSFEVEEYLNYLYGNDRGWVCLGFWGPTQDDWTQRFYRWPTEREEAVKDILTDREGVETYICPYLMKTKERAKGNSVSRHILHMDLDQGLTKEAMSKLESDGFKLIRTGGGRTYHAYLRLHSNLTPAQHRKYERVLRQQYNGDDKITDNDLLRPPLTTNYKLATPHQVITIYKGRVLGSQETEAFLSWLDAINGATEVTARTQWEDIDLDALMPARIPDSIRALMALPGIRGRRSEDCYAVVSAIAEHGYTLDQCHAMLHDFAPGLHKFDHRTGGWHDQIETIWNKWQAEHPQRTSKELVSHVDVINDTFWTETTKLARIKDTAIRHRCNPWAVLSVMIAKLLHSVPPHIWVGTATDSIKSFNLFIALVGKTSAGKGKAVEVGLKLIDTGEIINTRKPGSGEGLSKLFKYRKGSDSAWVTNSRGEPQKAVMSYAAEVSTINRLVERSGTTYFPELINAFDGGSLGFQNSDDSRTVIVEANTYRFSLLVGVQPENAGVLLREDNQWTGLAGRFLWVPSKRIEKLPESAQTEDIEPLRWHSPEWEVVEHRWQGQELAQRKRLGMDGIEFPFCDEVKKDISRMQRESDTEELERGDEWNPDPLEGHKIVLRKKVAVGLCLLHNGTEVSERAWKLAGQFMEVSDHTRSLVKQQLRKVGAEARRQRGEERAEEKIAERTKIDLLYQQKKEQEVKAGAEQIKSRMDKEQVDRISLANARAALSKHRQGLLADCLSFLGYRVEEGLRKGQVVVRDRPLKARRRVI
jgi:hypothetical protein